MFGPVGIDSIAGPSEIFIVADGSASEVLRPEILGPVYGETLRYGSWPTAGKERPFVLPWRD